MKIAIIGAGEMGGAFAEGLLKGNAFSAADVTVANPHDAKLKRFAEMGATVTTDNKAAVIGADFVTLVVKPWLIEEVIREIKPELDYRRQTILNMAASTTFAQLHEWLRKDGMLPPVFQIGPNIAIAHQQSMTFIAADKQAQDRLPAVEAIFSDLGSVLVTDEQHMSAGSALAGCGIAYALRYIRAASEGGVELGFKADIAKRIVMQTIKGAVTLLENGGAHPESEVDKVTTPGGLTIRGLNEMEHAGFTSAVIRGLKAGLAK